MIKIRLARHGSKNNIFYRIVAIEKGKKREGSPLDVLGTVNPGKNEVNIDKEKLKLWQSRGATVTKAVEKFLK